MIELKAMARSWVLSQIIMRWVIVLALIVLGSFALVGQGINLEVKILTSHHQEQGK